jgi:O-antigen/teichoic acid export membrane protein
MLTRSALGYLPARIIPALLGFLAVMVNTGLVGPEAYGRYALILTITAAVQSVLFQWLKLGMQRVYPRLQAEGKLAVLLSTTAACFAVTSLVAVVGWGLAVFCFPIAASFRHSFWLGAPVLVVQALFELVLELHRAELNPRRYGVLGTARSAIWIGLNVVCVLAFGERGLLWGLLLGTALTLAVDLAGYVPLLKLHDVDKALIAEVFQYGWPLTFSQACAFVTSLSDRLFLQAFLGASAVGLYAVGYDLTQQVLLALLMVIHLAAYPLAVRAMEQGGSEAAARRAVRLNELVSGTPSRMARVPKAGINQNPVA